MELFRWPNTWMRYAVAVASVAVASGLTLVMWYAGERAIFPLFFAAVVISACYGGLGPSLVATALAGAVTTALMYAAPQRPTLPHGHVERLLVFLGVALLTSSMNAALRRAREEERKAKRAAESASAAKSRFLAMIGHELRTPLNPVLMLATALEQDASLPKAVREDLATIRRNAELEARLVGDLLDLSRMAGAKLVLHLQPLEMSQLIRQALAVCEHEAAARGVELSIEVPDGDRLPLMGDGVRLVQVLWNLLRNAIKFTPAAGRITVRAWRDGASIVVSVRDTGIGIAPERLGEIFEAFEQGGPDVAARFGGLGLGLAIARVMAEAHGGTVIAHSEGTGRGATFTLRLPARTNMAMRAQSAPRTTLPAA